MTEFHPGDKCRYTGTSWSDRHGFDYIEVVDGRPTGWYELHEPRARCTVAGYIHYKEGYRSDETFGWMPEHLELIECPHAPARPEPEPTEMEMFRLLESMTGGD